VLRLSKKKAPWTYGVWDTNQRYERALLESGIAEKIDYFTNAVEQQMQLWIERFRQAGLPVCPFPGRLETIPWGVDMPQNLSKRRSRRVLAWKDSETVLLSLGRLSTDFSLWRRRTPTR